MAALASELGVATLVVEEPDGAGVITWAEGQAGRVDVPADTFTWSDGSFVHWVTRERQETGPDDIMSFAATFDGTSVCQAPGEIKSVVPRDDAIVGQPLEEHEFEPWESTESIAVFDATTGEKITDVPASTAVLYAGP